MHDLQRLLFLTIKMNEYYAKFSMIKDLFYTYIPYMECDENSLITIDPERNDIDEIGK